MTVENNKMGDANAVKKHAGWSLPSFWKIPALEALGFDEKYSVYKTTDRFRARVILTIALVPGIAGTIAVATSKILELT